ncbi:oligosaccharide flippase family protein [Cytobacillus suaedae]|nr:oligosaccharide flippase family protein [Cytobacillus suaedae]
MLAQLKRLGGDSLLYALMNVGTKLIAFIMLPIYTHYLPNPAEYGVLDYLDRITAMLTFLVIFGTDSALAFYYFDTKDEAKRKRYVQNVMLFRLGIVAVCFLAILVGGHWLSNALLDNPNYAHFLYLSIGILLLDTVVALILTVLRYEFKTLKVVIYTVLKMLLVAVLSYAILRFFLTSVEGILIGRIISAVVVLLLISKYLFSYLRFSIDKQLLKEILKYAAPLVPASIAFWVIVNANVFFLKEFTSFTEVGIYGTAMKFAALITLLTSGVQMAWRPYSMSLKDKKGSEFIFAKLYIAILLVGTLGVLFVATVMPWVIKLLDQNYYEAYKYVAPIAAVTFLNFFYMIISVGIFFSKQTKYISIAFGIAALVNLGLNFVLIPLYSIWGTVAAYLLSYIIAIILIFFKSQKAYFVPVSFFKMAFLFSNMLLAVFAIIYVQESGLSAVYILAAWAYFIVMAIASRVDRDFRKKVTTAEI